MENIAPFINLGWNTVPLKGELKRREDGTKTEPVFQKGWRQHYKENKNEKQARLGGTLTGQCSNIIAIDCDNTVTFALFKALDPEYEFIFKSKGKLDKEGEEKDCGTFIYSYDETFPDNFIAHDGEIDLDFYSNSGFVYLPTDANESKHAWSGRLPKVKELPPATALLLRQLKLATISSKVQSTAQAVHKSSSNCLQPLIEQFVKDEKFMPGLFKIITPRSFRTEAEYVKTGTLHPNNVPDGRGSDYLTRVSAILGADVSIDESLYVGAMHQINALWDSPIDDDRLDATIIDPMITKQAAIDGTIIWDYDTNWKQHRLLLHTKRQSSIELGFDDQRNLYYCVDIANEHVKVFHKDNDLIAYMDSTAINPPKKSIVKQKIPLLNVTSVPNDPFGFQEGDNIVRELNTFIRTPELSILSDPESYAKFYKRPETVLKFLDTLVPEKEMQDYLIKFIKRKLTLFEYSPVVLYFLGVHGSGKDTFVAILEQIMGLVSKPTTKEFLEMYNSWLLDAYFVQLDEYGNQLTNIRDREEALGKLKAFTGKSQVQIRRMRADSYSYSHNATFIMTANRQPLMLEDGDRRICFLPTPNVLAEAPWVEDMTEAYTKIMEEIKDFCYYLATEVPMMSRSEYMKPPESKNKRILIADSMYAAARLAYVLKHGMIDYIKDLAIDHSCSDMVNRAINNGRIYTTDLEPLYEAMTEFKGEMRALNKAIRGVGIQLHASTINNTKVYYYDLPWLNTPDFEADEEC